MMQDSLAAMRGRFIRRPSGPWQDSYLLLVLASSILGYLSLRGWTNICLFLLLLPALALWRTASADAAADGTLQRFRWLFLVLALPVAALLISQALRQDWIAKAYDGPLRMLLAIPLVLYFHYRRLDFARLLALTAPLALFILLLEVKLNPDALVHWGGRFATYFVDTDMFGVYALVLSAFCLFSIEPSDWQDRRQNLLLQVAGFLVGMYLVIGSNTRAAWVTLPALLGLWFLLRRHSLSRKAWLIQAAVVVVSLGLAFLLVPGAMTRLSSIYHEIASWLDGSARDTSAGLRLTMWHMSWELFKHSPWFGYGDTGYRAFLDQPWITSFATAEARSTIFVGPHNEFLANLLRSGIFGGLSVLGLFFVPFALFWRVRLHADSQVARASHLGLAYLLCMVVTSISFEVFTLKYTATFYGIIVAGLAAQAFQGRNHASTVENAHVAH